MKIITTLNEITMINLERYHSLRMSKILPEEAMDVMLDKKSYSEVLATASQRDDEYKEVVDIEF